MKKVLAFFTAAICCFGVFTACGSKESSNSDKTSASDNADNSALSESTVSVQGFSGDEFAEPFRTFFISGDQKQMLEVSLPDDVIKSMENIGGVDSISEALASAVEQSMSDVPEINAGMIEYISERECVPEFRSKMEKLYSAYYDIYRTMENSGISYADYLDGKVDEKSMNLLTDAFDKYEKLSSGEDIDTPLTITFEDIRVVILSIHGDQSEFVMYKVNGEDWKLDTIGLAVFEY